jgi:hypothetical protein
MIQPRLRLLWLVPLALLPALVGPSYAGIFFKKNKKPTPGERVPELLAIVKTDGDESKRAAAAQELRQYDPGQFPMIVPVLVDVLMTDGKPGVRAEAAQSLGKMRPIAPQAGMALEQASSNDSSMRVRLQARSSLLQYHWSGYRSARKEDRKNEMMPQTKEPPLADDKAPPIINTTTLSPSNERFTPQPADGSRCTSGYRSPPPAPFPYVPQRPASPAPPPPVRQGNDGGPELSPP